jgi:hypothetical protein
VRRAAEASLAAHAQHSDLAVRFDVIVERDGRLERVRDAY